MDRSVICAIATASGSGAIAILRLSGAGAVELADRLFVAPSGKHLKEAAPNTALFGQIVDEGMLLDEVLVTVFRSPHSFTGEDTVEIACHGSPYIQQRLLQLLVRTGARLAAPGEFTLRAFLNGKMDLSQAEAVADLIASSSAAAHRMAMNQMKGGFSSELRRLREEMLQIITLLELELDFSEEEVEFAERTALLELAVHIRQLLTRLAHSFSLGNVIKNGVPVAIAGNTNVGKSTLLNALLNEERALVSDVAGTTRDAIEETVNLNGVLFRFIDTAGIRETSDLVETMGIERTFAKIEQAGVVLLMTDLSRGTESFSYYYQQVKARLAPSARLIILLNKTDITADLLTPLETIRLITSGEEILPISARTGDNIPLLMEKLTEVITANPFGAADVIVSNTRHYEALLRANEAIERAIAGLKTSVSSEFIAQDVRECLHYIGEITGTITTDEVLGNIFSKFCIGK